MNHNYKDLNTLRQLWECLVCLDIDIQAEVAERIEVYGLECGSWYSAERSLVASLKDFFGEEEGEK